MSRDQTDLESWGRAVQDVEGHRLLDLEERRKREIEEQLSAYMRGERLGIWKCNPAVAKRIPQRMANLEAKRAEIIARRRSAIEEPLKNEFRRESQIRGS